MTQADRRVWPFSRPLAPAAGLAKELSADIMARRAGNTPGTINEYYSSLHLRLDALKATGLPLKYTLPA